MALALVDGTLTRDLDPIERFTSPRVIQRLLSLNEFKLTHLVEEVSLIIYISNCDDTFKFNHQSLTNFFIDPQRSPDDALFIDAQVACDTLMRGYLRSVQTESLVFLIQFLGHHKKAVLTGMEHLQDNLAYFFSSNTFESLIMMVSLWMQMIFSSIEICKNSITPS